MPGGKSEGLVYDSEGRLVSRTDFDGSQTIYSYDVGGKLSKVTRSDGRSLSQGYDSFGRMNSQTDTAYGNCLTLDGNDARHPQVWSHSSLGTSFSATLDYAGTPTATAPRSAPRARHQAGYNTLNQLETLTTPMAAPPFCLRQRRQSRAGDAADAAPPTTSTTWPTS
ncbi:RHS repeat domain-containing protein [Comamonas sp. JC664]|uniref:RHS repeat domain-containing protein n=1 Tax=Comamonas sp. JC664 TaxID=2801917 RepID=UPI003606DB2A